MPNISGRVINPEELARKQEAEQAERKRIYALYSEFFGRDPIPDEIPRYRFVMVFKNGHTQSAPSNSIAEMEKWRDEIEGYDPQIYSYKYMRFGNGKWDQMSVDISEISTTMISANHEVFEDHYGMNNNHAPLSDFMQELREEVDQARDNLPDFMN